MPSQVKPHTLVHDGGGNWYIIPVEHFAHWVEWFQTPDDELEDELPWYAERVVETKVGFHLTFTAYKREDVR